MIVLRNNNLIWNGLLDTGSERCILNYKNFKHLGNEEITESNVVLQGVNGVSAVKGEINLQLSLESGKKCRVTALLVKNSNFPYDMILGRDVLKGAEINLKECNLKLGKEVIPFMDKFRISSKEIIASDCLIGELLLLGSKSRKTKLISKIKEGLNKEEERAKCKMNDEMKKHIKIEKSNVEKPKNKPDKVVCSC